MGPDPKILDDIAKVAGGAVNILSGLQQQIREEVKSRIDDAAARMDLVPREDLDRAEAMIARLRRQQDDFETRLDALEKGSKKTAAKKAPARKAAAKKKPATKKKATTQKAKK